MRLQQIIRSIIENSYDPYDRDSWVDDENEPVDEPVNPVNFLDSNGRYFTSENKYRSFRNEPDQNERQKPVGLWYACGTEWIEYLRVDLRVSYPDRYETDQYIYQVQPIYKKMVTIRNVSQFRKFTEKFGYEDSDELIRWDLVAEQYAGIEICPHLSRMKKHPWYSHWDVSSGCIWSQSAIDWIQPVMERDSSGFWTEISGKLLK